MFLYFLTTCLFVFLQYSLLHSYYSFLGSGESSSSPQISLKIAHARTRHSSMENTVVSPEHRPLAKKKSLSLDLRQQVIFVNKNAKNLTWHFTFVIFCLDFKKENVFKLLFGFFTFYAEYPNY